MRPASLIRAVVLILTAWAVPALAQELENAKAAAKRSSPRLKLEGIKNDNSYKGLVLLLLLLVTPNEVRAAEAPKASSGIRIVPKPLQMQEGQGTYALSEGTAIYVKPSTPKMRAIGNYLADLVAPASGLKPAVKSPWFSKSSGIVLRLEASQKDLGDEGYTLACTPKGVFITAAKPAGVFYGVQTLRQLLPVQIESRQDVAGVTWAVPCVSIRDLPRFRWRGYLLDPARHFRTKEEIKRYVDLLAFQKLNVLQLHLTDDQGWRVEIPNYPKLTATGSRLPNVSGKTGEGWFYSQADIREMVAHAASRYVTLMPEIEMPGHSGAATTSYPLLGCDNRPSSELCVSKESTFEYATNVLEQVMTLFPSPYLHVGADEVAPGRWRTCPQCKARMDELAKIELPADVLRARVNVTSGAGRPFDEKVGRLQGEFIRRLDLYLASRGRRMVGWDEILEGGLSSGSGAMVMAWRSAEAIAGATGQKREVIVAMYPEYYLDNNTPLQRTYEYEPVPPNLPAELAKYVMGVQGNMWGEGTPTIQRVDVQSFPRLCAIAEIGWTLRDGRSFDDFANRLTSLCRRFDLMGVNYRIPDGAPPR